MFRSKDDNPHRKWYISKSEIHGFGVFSSRRLKKGSKIGTGITYFLGFISSITSDFGSMINHSYHPNAVLKYNDDERVWIVYAKESISKDTEITIDYNDTPWFIEGPRGWYS